MAMVRVDPAELDAAASTIRNAAVELAEIGAQLGSCVSCPLPPDIEALIGPYMSIMDAILDKLALWLNSEANDLTNRAAIAATDIVSAGSVFSPAAIPASAGATIPGVGAFPVFSSPGIIGGNSFSSSIATVGSGSTMVIGGHVEPPITLIDPATGQAADLSRFGMGAGIIGGASAGSRSNENPAMILANAAESHRQKAEAIANRIMASPNPSPAGLAAVTNFRESSADNIRRILATSQADMEAKVGHILTRSEYYELVPEARPSPGSPIL